MRRNTCHEDASPTDVLELLKRKGYIALPVTRRLSLCALIALVVTLAACNAGAGPPSASSPAGTNTTARTTMASDAGSSTTTTGIGVTSTTADANNDLGIDRALPDVDITDRWVVTEFTVDGDWHTVEFGRDAENEPVAGANAHHEPWIEFGEDVRGDPGGCNEFGGEYFIEGNALALEGMITLMACGDDLMAVENAFGRLAAEEVIRVDVEGESMTWSTSAASLRFVRGD